MWEWNAQKNGQRSTLVDSTDDDTKFVDIMGDSPYSNTHEEFEDDAISIGDFEPAHYPNPLDYYKYGSKRLPQQKAIGSPQQSHSSSIESDDYDDMNKSIHLPMCLPSATAEAMQTYENILANIYCGSASGRSIAEESMPCECKYDPDVDDDSAACGDDNFCINRMMFMECMVDDCHCGRYCQNRRFQLCQYARVDVIKTEKKGFGLRALTDLPANAFIMEYIGEVIPNNEFVRRTREYEAEGLEHYYFMTLKTDEIIDATKKGCLARFINHSCKPNSVTQKWVIGKKMRIGIFTTKFVKAGDELTFDYKFERYGAVAQKCYCGESCCKGYIGGALGTADQDSLAGPCMQPSDDEEDTDGAGAVTISQKRSLRKRSKPPQPLHDPDEVQSFVKKMLDSVGKAHLVNRLLLRLELTNPDNSVGREVLKNFVRLHGLKMLKFWLGEWKGDEEIVKKVLRVLDRLPLANKNGLEDCKMFDVIQRLTDHEDQEIKMLAQKLETDWGKLKSIYRIPKRAVWSNKMLSQYVERKSEKVAVPDGSTGLKRAMDQENGLLSRKKARFTSTREFFDPDDDYFEYLSLDADQAEIEWKLRFPPRPLIPTAPRAMLDWPVSTTAYPGYIQDPAAMYTLKDGQYRYIGPTDPAMEATDFSVENLYDVNQVYTNDAYQLSLAAYQESYNAAAAAEAAQYDASIEGATETADGRRLPPNWRSASTEDGSVYYYNILTRKSQWLFPEERESSIEGVSQEQIEGQIEHAILESERKKRLEEGCSPSPANSIATSKAGRSPHTMTPTASTSGSTDAQSVGDDPQGPFLNDIDLKREIGKVVTKYLSARQQSLWKGDKKIFKDLARKMTHHIVDRELQSGRKIAAMTSALRTKIEKFMDLHGADFAEKLSRLKSATPSSTVP
ncbi:hypothetical protein CLU79DRAFT_858673 [Phycomyces nitens]|nr:hypothetical protein CLU79DRAFT_858673 [Phycomyces nitens]